MAQNVQLHCRVCLRKCKSRHVSLQDFFKLGREEELVAYAKAYTACTQLEVQAEPNGMPELLCNSCSRDLQCAYEFRNKAIKGFDKLYSQLLLQKHENVARAVTPSEFELPDNDMAVAYMRADADLIDACSIQTAKCSKDPLEDSESENEIQTHLNLAENRLESQISTHSFSDFVYDSEDDKPLKQLISKNKSDAVEKLNLYDQNLDAMKTPLVHPVNGSLYDDDDEFIADENADNEKITDPMYSPEAHIFPKGRFKCAICEQSYFTTIGLKAHMEVHLVKSATTKKKRVRSKKCNRSKKPNSEYEGPRVNVNCDNSDSLLVPSSENILCEEKESETPQQTAKNCTKTRRMKEPKPKRMFPCHVCGKHMISASKLRYHMVMHTGEKDYLCTMCPKAYSTIYALNHHMRTHTGERPYECKFCGDRFLRTTTLKSHQRRHTGERPYGCDICGKRFIQHSSMTTHMKLNHMDKTIQCPHCDKKYARQTDLNTHLLSHTGDKPYPCQLCQSRFVRQANLNKHMNQQHADKAGVSNIASLNTTNSMGKRGVVKIENSSDEVVLNLFTDNESDLKAVASNTGMDNSNTHIDDKLPAKSNIVDNYCNFMSARNVSQMLSGEAAHMLAVETFEQLDSDNLVPWN
ncbi:zinc finger protein 568-like isoform X1 [Anastrepha ludens]|uniref:zinc finger protein 568-like isoform X1 n=1 Tax=Anastrepha ludens TaxID=28586 RepID=UPI0023B04097|nr:zinc finger protein 568-like isoform X1 [Anastrepha ludens]